jgi:penicillin-binding protein 1A
MPRRRKPLYRRRLVWFAVLAIAGSGGALFWGYQKIERSLPDTADIATFVRDGTLTIKASDGAILQQLGPATREKLTFQKIPTRLVQAFIASEDRRFYQHNGVDYQSIVRAVSSNLLAHDVVEGASTITQQLARLVFLTQERSLWRKLQEAFLAQKIERELSKTKILEQYLNLVYLGSGAYGVADAAWVYFSKPVDQLTLSELATIAGLPPAPSDYSPLVNPQAARQRRDIVLDRMVEAGYINETEANAASAQPLTLKPSTPKNLDSAAPYFTSYVQKQLSQHVSKDELEAGGLTVETTLNAKWQQIADKVVHDNAKNAGSYEGFSQTALVAIDPRNGEIRAMVGGTDFNKSQFNRATQAQRQPGSSFKAILYTTAIATGMSPNDGYEDAPFRVDGYQPENYSRKYRGWMTLRDAMTNSINIISVKLIIDVGFDPVIGMAKDMGIKSSLMPTYSLALGASEVNLLELTNAYSTLAAQGEYTEAHGIRRIFNRKGQMIYDATFKPKRVIDKVTTAIVTWMMQSVVNSGTGQAAQIDRPVAGKTGTSEKARDLWFIGFIPQLVTGVWLGNDDNSPTWSASSTAAGVWHDFMALAVKGIPVEKFPELPKLDGRKGSIKAKPVKPGRAHQPSYSPEESSSRSEPSYSRHYRDSEPPRRDPAPSRSDTTPSNSGPAETAPVTPVAPAEPVSPVAPEPAPPAAEPAPPVAPAEPAPPAPSGSPASSGK